MGKQYLSSMTGYGRGSASGEQYRVSVDLRSVNGRFLEMRIKCPRFLAAVESEIRSHISKVMHRGMIDVSVNVQALAGAIGENINQTVARSFAKEIEDLSNNLNISSGLTGISLLKLPGVVQLDEAANEHSIQDLSKLVLMALKEATDSLLEMRRSEGEKLQKVLKRELDEMQSHRVWIYKHREELNDRYFKKLQGRLSEWTSRTNSSLDETRIYQEVAYYLDRSDIAEELDRLGSHLKQCEDALAKPDGKSVGKRLDFLAQELGREVNTIGSKSDQVIVTNHVMEMKMSLERVREQVQNIE